MNRNRSSRSQPWQLVLGLLICLQPTTALALFVPSGLNPGDEYRIAFITDSNSIQANSTEIDFYNDAVNDEAARSTLTEGVDYFAVASTEMVDARDNVGSSSAPIYLVDDTLLANGTDDLWDGDILTVFRVDQFGVFQFSATEVWTGSRFDGMAFPNQFLGADMPRYGQNQFTDLDWVSNGNNFGSNQSLALYGISEVLVIPEPAPVPALGRPGLGLLIGALAIATAMLAAGVHRSRRDA